MRPGILIGGLIAVALTLGPGLGSAHAFVAGSALGLAPDSLVTPAAMCGRSCAGGGRYIPGPPGVCRDNGLRYCGPSRDPGPRVVVPLPGPDVIVRPPRGEVCRTVTIRRPDGSSRTTRECR